MQAKSLHFGQPEPPLSRYATFDSNSYHPPIHPHHPHHVHHTSSATFDTALNAPEVYHYIGPVGDRSSRLMNLAAAAHPLPPPPPRDAITHHMLYETAMLDTQAYEVLDVIEVDTMKKEHARLLVKIETTTRKLSLEGKVRDAAQNLQRLYSVSSKSRPDTPMSEGLSRRRSRSSLLTSKRRTSGSTASLSGQTLHQAEDEIATSVKKVEELKDTIKTLSDRRQYVECRLLRHTAAVLAEQAHRTVAKTLSGSTLTNGAQGTDTLGDDSTSTMHRSTDEFDGIRDLLPRDATSNGLGSGLQPPAPPHRTQHEHEQQMASVQDRLEQLNLQLRHVIGEASRVRGVQAEPELDLHDTDNDPNLRLDKRFSRLESNLRTLQQAQVDVKVHYAQVQDSAYKTRNAVETQLQGVNGQLHKTLLLASGIPVMEALPAPPQVTGHGYQPQLQYLEESLGSLERVLQLHRAELDGSRDIKGEARRGVEDAHAKMSVHANKVGEYEATLGGLWEILQSAPLSERRSGGDSDSDGADGSKLEGVPLQEDFSLQAFSARVQLLFDRAQASREQQDILRRQIQQQREVNGKAEGDREKAVVELQGRYDELLAQHTTVRGELDAIVSQLAQVESEAREARLELLAATDEVEELRNAAEGTQAQHDERYTQQLRDHQSHTATAQEQLRALETQIAALTDEARLAGDASQARDQDSARQHADDLAHATSARDAAESRHAAMVNDMQGLEGEVVRLTTELTMAKAELDGAYGSRAERAREAQAAEVAGLTQQNAQMDADLQSLRTLHSALVAEHEQLRQGPALESPRTSMLEAELRALTSAYADLTHESTLFERERVQLEDLVDSLRDKCEVLEAQLGDEKVRWMGMSSPGAGTGGAGARGSWLQQQRGGEMTSTRVLRQEFRSMVREVRGEGVKLLRAEQDHRRRLEAELRRLRQGASGRQLAAHGGAGADSTTTVPVNPVNSANAIDNINHATMAPMTPPAVTPTAA